MWTSALICVASRRRSPRAAAPVTCASWSHRSTPRALAQSAEELDGDTGAEPLFYPPPTRVSAPGRIVAIGDLHGDLAQVRTDGLPPPWALCTEPTVATSHSRPHNAPHVHGFCVCFALPSSADHPRAATCRCDWS